MRRLIPYGPSVAVAAGAEFLLFYVMYVYVLCGSLACVPSGDVANRQVTGWDIVLGNYFMGISGAVGGLLGLVVAARLELRHGWRLSLAQGIIAAFVPLAQYNQRVFPGDADLFPAKSASVRVTMQMET
jgi:hypothetical protein